MRRQKGRGGAVAIAPATEEGGSGCACGRVGKRGGFQVADVGFETVLRSNARARYIAACKSGGL